MGSQSSCSDPYPLPSFLKTNSPWLPLTPPLVLQLDGHQLSLSVTLGWQFSPSPELKLPFSKPGLTTGASSDHRSRYESTPPSGRLVSDPPLLTGRNGLPFPLSRNCTLRLNNCRAQVKNDTFNSVISVHSLRCGLSHPSLKPFYKKQYFSGFSGLATKESGFHLLLTMYYEGKNVSTENNMLSSINLLDRWKR